MSVRGEAKILRRRATLACPDVKALRALVAEVTGVEIGAQRRLADMIGVRTATVGKWAKGSPVPHVYVAKITEVEAKLKTRVEREVPPVRAEKTLPLMANVVSVRVEGEQALVSFSLKVPGEETARSVAEILVPRTALAREVTSI